MKLEDKSIVITGAGRGIGLACARELLGRGARVTIAATSTESIGEATERLGASESLAAVAADVSTPEGARAVSEAAVAAFGAIDGLFANAGGYAEGPIEEMAPSYWDEAIAKNLRTTFLAIQACLPELRRTRGAIVTMGSFNGVTGVAGHAGVYGAAKAAVANLTKSLALDLAPDVRCNCLAPGFIETEKLHARDDAEELIAALSETIPAGRFGTGEEVAHALVFLFENEYMDGAVLNVDGGRIASA
jgi:NAD(P)-dependent dehydrogenase (short-subunit alcohol dehydrogenase family)